MYLNKGDSPISDRHRAKKDIVRLDEKKLITKNFSPMKLRRDLDKFNLFKVFNHSYRLSILDYIFNYFLRLIRIDYKVFPSFLRISNYSTDTVLDRSLLNYKIYRYSETCIVHQLCTNDFLIYSFICIFREHSENIGTQKLVVLTHSSLYYLSESKTIKFLHSNLKGNR